MPVEGIDTGSLIGEDEVFPSLLSTLFIEKRLLRRLLMIDWLFPPMVALGSNIPSAKIWSEIVTGLRFPSAMF